MAFRFKNWKLKYKLLIVCLLLSIIPLVVLGLSSYFLADRALYKQIDEKLKTQAADYKTILTENMSAAQNDTAAARADAQTIVKQLAQMLAQLFRLARNASEEELKNTVASFTVGKTGYVYVLDYEGRYVVSKGRARDGENIYNSTDANGRLFIQEIIKKGRALSSEGVDFDIYPWKNVGETSARDKIAAIIHLPRLGWVVGVSAYFDDLVDVNLQQKMIDRFKAKLKGEKVGQTGYMYVMDGKATLVMHPDKEGQSLADYDFAKEMIRKKAEGGFIQYNWEGGDKVVAYTYYEPFDWIIASGSYLADFTQELTMIQIVILTTMVVAIALVLLVSLLFAGWIYKNLNRTAGSLSSSSLQISSAAVQLSNSSQEIASGASEQASSIEETTSSMEELASMVRQNLQNAKEASSLAGRAASSSATGFDQMEKMLVSMKEINKSSDQISRVIKIIDDIAFQTNILALNAAVEAARAGEAGMGFAVVADEVKNLANRSAEAAKETSLMIEDSIKKTEEGLNMATRLAEVFKDILNNSQKVSEMSKEVETASTQQDAGINQVNKAIVQFDEVVQANASAAEETASSAEELQSQVDALNGMVGELLVLINGKSAIDEHGRLETRAAATVAGRKRPVLGNQPASPAVKTAPKKAKAISPEKLIPFEEDEEFKEKEQE